MVPAVRHGVAWLALIFSWTHFAQAQHALYRLPYAEGEAFMITQAPGGWISTHRTPESRHAVDIAMPEGTPVLAARKGVVIAAEWSYVAGGRIGALRASSNFVRVRHADGSIGNYAHLIHAGVAVEAGETVHAGKILGYAGSTGFSSGPHLHFAVTRETRNAELAEEVSEPVTFYVGKPPVAFAPRVGLAVTANYSSPAEPPAPQPETSQPVFSPPRGESRAGWSWLVALAMALAGTAWFYRFSRS